MTARKPDRRQGIVARKIELYSLAYRTAWRRFSPLQKREQPNLALWLHAFIRRQIKKGATDPFLSPPRRLRPSVRASRERS